MAGAVPSQSVGGGPNCVEQGGEAGEDSGAGGSGLCPAGGAAEGACKGSDVEGAACNAGGIGGTSRLT